MHTFCKWATTEKACMFCFLATVYYEMNLSFVQFSQIVSFQLVPGLEQSEYKREREFYEERGLPCPKDMEVEAEKDDQNEEE